MGIKELTGVKLGRPMLAWCFVLSIVASVLLMHASAAFCASSKEDNYLIDWHEKSDKKYTSPWVWGMDEGVKWHAATLSSDEAFEMFKYFWKPRKSNRTTYDHRPGAMHISIPNGPSPDQSSSKAYKARNLKFNHWFVEFDKARVFKEREMREIRKLDALAAVGMLLKSDSSFDKNGMKVASFKYTITDFGWKYLRHDSRSFEFCYGAPRIVKLESFGPTIISEQAGLEVYYVTSQVGIAGIEDLEPWARDPRILEAFPEIKKQLKSKSVTMNFVRGASGWCDLEKLGSRRAAPGRQPAVVKKFSSLSNLERKRFKESVKQFTKIQQAQELSEKEAKNKIFSQTVGALLKIDPSLYKNTFVDFTEYRDEDGLQQFRFRLRGVSPSDPQKRYMCYGNKGHSTCYWDEPPEKR